MGQDDIIKYQVLTAFLSVPLAWYANWRYLRLPLLNVDQVNALPSLSIIIPARNEANNLPKLLNALNQLTYPGQVEVIVVDDNSQDNTADIATQFGVKLLRLKHLPAGWLGKPHACHQGALYASGDWLLFIDADTWLAPNLPAAGVSYALSHHQDGLSLFLKQQTQSFWDGLSLAAAFAGFFAGFTHRAYLNGQFILLAQTVYHASGGFKAVRQEALEDLALGQLMHKQGYAVSLLRAETSATVAMYADPVGWWQGMSRLGAGALRWSSGGWIATAATITSLMTPLIALYWWLMRRLKWPWLFVTWLASIVSIWPWARRFGVIRWAWLAPVGAFLVQAAAVWGLLQRLAKRRIIWKGRQISI